MKVYNKALTDREIKKVVKNGKLDAVINISLSDTIDAEGIDGFNDLVDSFFPELMLSNLSYEVVGFDTFKVKDGNYSSSKLHVRVQAEVDEELFFPREGR